MGSMEGALELSVPEDSYTSHFDVEVGAGRGSGTLTWRHGHTRASLTPSPRSPQRAQTVNV